MAATANKLRLTLDMIKFPHSVFALPFALASAFYARSGVPSPREIILIVLCMVTARNAAMSFNRIVDRDIDAKNPRTNNRPLVTGALSTNFAIAFCIINCVSFILLSATFNKLTLALSPAALAIVLGYSLTKRFTHATQFFLGLALGSSPIASWIALTGGVTAFPLLIGAAVFCWVAGFDLIYSCQDYGFDKQNGVKNWVVSLGIKNALLVSKFLHALCILLFVLAGIVLGTTWLYFAGVLAMAGCLIYEHGLVRHDDLSRVNAAFFTMNGYVALVFFAFSLADVFYR